MRRLSNQSVCIAAIAVALACSLDLLSVPHECDSVCRETSRYGYSTQTGYVCHELQNVDCAFCVSGKCRDTNGPGSGNCVSTNTDRYYRDCSYACAFYCETSGQYTEVSCGGSGDFAMTGTAVHVCAIP
jgi:hypothetical protein